MVFRAVFLLSFIVSSFCLADVAKENTFAVGGYKIAFPIQWQKIPVEEAVGMFTLSQEDKIVRSSYISCVVGQEMAPVSNWWEVWKNHDNFSQIGVVMCKGLDSCNSHHDWNVVLGHLQRKRGVQFLEQGEKSVNGKILYYVVFMKKEAEIPLRAIYYFVRDPRVQKKCSYLVECYVYGKIDEFESKKAQFDEIASSITFPPIVPPVDKKKDEKKKKKK